MSNKILEKRADELGISYVEVAAEAKDVYGRKEKIALKIKDFASRKGTVVGKQTIVIGRKYVVGFTTPEASKEIDYKKLLLLQPDLKDVIFSLMPDPDKVEKAVAEGVISKQLLAKCLKESDKELSDRVYVATKTKFDEDQAKNQEAIDTAA